MTGGNKVIAEFLRFLKKSRKFNEFVASYARVRCSSLFIFFGEIIEDFLFENFAEIKDIMRNPEKIRNGFCVLCFVPIIKKAEGCSRNLVTLFF